MARSTNNDAKGFWQAIERKFAALLPRQAVVTRPEGKSVWVRLATEDSSAQESQFVSTVSGVPAGTVGWVFALGGGKGLFVVTSPTGGPIYSRREISNPSSTPTTVVATSYASCDVLLTVTVGTLFPEITEGVWDIDVTAWATVYRSVATGGVRLYVGDGTTDGGAALGRGFPQTGGYTLNVAATFTGMTASSTIDRRFGGFSTAGTTYVVSHGWKLTARRKI